MRGRLLDAAQERLLADERALLGDLLAVLTRLDAPPDEVETLRRSIRHLDELFLLVVIGEFNAGKSAFVNALVGASVLEEGVTPTTTRLGVLTWGETVARVPMADGADRVTAPVELLRAIGIVDTPGTNAVQREHEALTREFVPRSDLVLFVTSADRPFTESERAFLESVRDWGKKIVVAINKVDILETEADRTRVVQFVTENALKLLGVTPPVFPVSAPQGAAREGARATRRRWPTSGFAALEDYVTETLDEGERVRLKLLNPLGVAENVLARQEERGAARRELLREDFETVGNLEGQLAVYGEDLGRDFRFRLSDVEKELLEMERRGNDFFDDTLRIGRIFDLLSHHKVKRAFEQKVVGDLPRVVERQVEQVVLWMVDSDQRQWRAIVEHLERRRRAHEDRIVGSLAAGFDHDRVHLLDEARHAAQRALEQLRPRLRVQPPGRLGAGGGRGHGRAAGGRARPGHDRDHGREHGRGGRDRPPGRGRALRHRPAGAAGAPGGRQDRAAREGRADADAAALGARPEVRRGAREEPAAAAGGRRALHALRALRARAAGRGRCRPAPHRRRARPRPLGGRSRPQAGHLMR